MMEFDIGGAIDIFFAVLFIVWLIATS